MSQRTKITGGMSAWFGPDEERGEVRVEITRRQIGDRMASDLYVTVGNELHEVTFPFRQLRKLCNQAEAEELPLTPWENE